jgi:hypothetical protein
MKELMMISFCARVICKCWADIKSWCIHKIEDCKKEHETYEFEPPWRVIAIMAIIFGLVLIINRENKYLNILQSFGFGKLNWQIFMFSGSLIALAMFIKQWTKFRCLYAVGLSLLFNGLVGGYIGLSIWNFWIAQSRDGIEFLMIAWTSYVFYFIALDITKYGIENDFNKTPYGLN